MIQANRLSAPGEQAALERVEAIVKRIDGLRIEMFALSGLALPDPDEHAALVAELEAEAERSGRRELLEDVRERVRSSLVMRITQGTRFDPESRARTSPTRADDSARAVVAAVDAASVALMEDRLSPTTAARLAAPGRLLLGLPPLPEEPIQLLEGRAIPEPTAEDWAEAARGDTRPGDYEPLPVGLRVGIATMAAVILAPAAIFVGVGAGQTPMGILGGLAVVAVCWLIATYKVRD